MCLSLTIIFWRTFVLALVLLARSFQGYDQGERTDLVIEDPLLA